MRIATVYPLYDFSRQVAGDRPRVQALVPAGIEPHHWEPTPRDIARLQQARVLVYNGVGLEPWLGRLLPELRRRNVVTVNATEGLPLLAAEARDRGKDTNRKHRHADRHGDAVVYDPHVWLDPVSARLEQARSGPALAPSTTQDQHASPRPPGPSGPPRRLPSFGFHSDGRSVQEHVTQHATVRIASSTTAALTAARSPNHGATRRKTTGKVQNQMTSATAKGIPSGG